MYVLAAFILTIFLVPSLSLLEFSDYNFCFRASGLDPKHIRVDHNEELKKFLFCVNKKNGIQRENGSFVREEISRRLVSFVKLTNVTEEIINKCAKEKETPEESAYEYTTCMQNLIAEGPATLRLNLFYFWNL